MAPYTGPGEVVPAAVLLLDVTEATKVPPSSWAEGPKNIPPIGPLNV
jgi:hypothetical protein